MGLGRAIAGSLAAAAVLGTAWAGGFALFLKDIAAAGPRISVEPPAAADGVVVFTGGPHRMTSAMALFEEGVGERLLISGVHPETTREKIAALWTGRADAFECCIDLGHTAASTEGNAAELAAWAHRHGFRRVVIVTSDYHVPRAMLEARRRMPGAELTPYPVASGVIDARARPRDLDGLRRLASEYTKYLAVRLAPGRG